MKKYNILLLILIFTLSLSAVSAQDTNYTDISDSASFSSLNDEINNAENEINLNHDYKYNYSCDSEKLSSNFIVVNKTSFVINGNGNTLDPDNTSGVFSFLGGNITVNNLKITNSFNSFTIKALCSNLVLNNVEFTNCGDGDNFIIASLCPITLNNCSFDNFHASAIYAEFEKGNFDVNINDCSFSNSHTGNKGAVYTKYANLNINNSRFENLTGVYAASVLYCGNSTLQISNTQFRNIRSSITGGAVIAKGNAEEFPSKTEILIENSEFSNVSSAKNGGAIFYEVDNGHSNRTFILGSMDIVNTTFNDCSAEFGGAVMQLNGELTIINSTFTNNKASVTAGALYTSYVDFNINNTDFINNSALKYGGAVYVEVTNSTIDNSVFIGNAVENSSIENPSTIYAYDNILHITNSYFNNSLYSISAFFTDEFVDENNTYADDEFYTNLTIYSVAYTDTGLKLDLINNTIDVNTLPSRFDLRDWGWVTPVKNQGDGGSCWAFGGIAAIESAILKATGVSYDFSENNVQNSEIGYNRYGYAEAFEGGFQFMNLGYMLSWMGLLPQEEDIYDEYGKVSDILDSVNKIHVQDVLFIPIIKDENNLTSNDTNYLIKMALMEYGAVQLWFAGDGNFYDPKSTSIYHNATYVSNHMVSIVGWDDNYSADKFLITPPGDGAWIIKNSWGTDWGENGFAYLSYYDTSAFALSEVELYTAAFIIENTENYNYNYQTDFLGLWGFNQNYTYYANKFEAADNSIIAAVGTYFNGAGVEYNFKIYVNDVLKFTQNGTSEFPGFRTIKLNEYVPVMEGDEFTVVFESNAVPYQQISRQHYMTNMSFVSDDGDNWFDLAENDQTVCLKVYTLAADIISSDLEKIYRNSSKFAVNVGEVNQTVIFEINNVNYTRTSNENGSASLAINLEPGEYNITTYVGNNSVTNRITVLPTLIADNLVKYYHNASQFYVELIDGEGNPLANKTITLNINGVLYNCTTNASGIARLNINLHPGEYIITVIDLITGLKMSYNITVLPVLSADNLVMSYKDGSKFTAKLNNGAPIANKNVTFNVNGVIYNRLTNESGIASLNINLMAGEYIITSTYEGTSVSNKITIKS